MRQLRPGSEAEMIALFLRTELFSDRFGPGIRALIERDGVPGHIVAVPDLDDHAGNQARARLLTAQRGFSNRTDYFEGFPGDVRWDWMAITPDELAGVRYIDYSYWNELSGGSRLAADAAPFVRAGMAPFGYPSEHMVALSEQIAAGARVPPLILVTTGPGGPVVVMEGHVRLTAFMLIRDRLPPELEVLVGASPAMTQWGCW